MATFPDVTTALPLPRAAAKPSVRAPNRSRLTIAAIFVAAHAVLGVAMHAFHVIATIHALACGAVGIILAASTRRIQRVAFVLAYIAGSEVLWRMNKASVFWEFGKLASIAVLLLALMRIRVRRNRGLAVAYVALLLPSIALTVARLDFGTARQDVTFNLAGPFALALAVLFFSNIRLSTRDLLVTFVAVLGPVLGIATISFVSTISHTNLDFVNAANSVTSGGFGPNEVAAMLGLGMMFLLLVTFDRRFPLRIRGLLFLLAAAFAAQAALTFARGGLVLALSGLIGASFYMMRGNPRARVTILVVAVLGFVIGNYVIEPKLERFTGGELSYRYTDTKSDGRNLIIASELEMFEQHPLMGVGPGIGARMRVEQGLFRGASHTEYTRMLAEHGLFGAIALLCLLALMLRAVRQANDTKSRALATALVIWAALFMSVYATRIVAPAFILGLAFAVPRAANKARSPTQLART